MAVTSDDIQSLHEKVDANKLEFYQVIHKEIAAPINDLTVQLRELIADGRHQEKAFARISRDIESLKCITSDTQLELAETKIKLSGILWGMMRFGTPLIFGILSLSGLVELIERLKI